MTRHRRPALRWIGAAAVLVSVIGFAATATPPGTAAAAPAPALATRQSVVSGDARFEVLSPTLIRLEYAGDGVFTDALTFNAIGRDNFRPTSFSQSVSDGWLTVTTAELTLRYQVGSGPFGADNLSVRLRTEGQTITARPTFTSSASCVVGALCEGEKATLSGGVSAASDHTGFTGSGFAAGFTSTPSSLTYQLTVPTAGSYQLQLRYANSVGGDGQNTTRTLSAAIDGGSPSTITMPPTADWNTWALASVPATSLSAGTHTLVISRGPNDSGNVNIDSLAVTTPGAAYPAPTTTAASCGYDTVCEAENGVLADGAGINTDHNGYSGPGFVDGLTSSASDTVAVTGVPAAGSYSLQVRYANGASPSVTQSMSTEVDGGAASASSLAPTADWDTWSTATIPVTLAKGANTIALSCPAANGCAVNLDTVAIAPTTAPVLLAHSPLGGYRRGLDGVDGNAVTTPGLLYRDGWYLLDDTPSAIYDPTTKSVQPRPTHDGKPYQDGYFFGYGDDYQQGLADLATLTGPSILLPRWAYGVWFSEYYDYTAADYQNTILPTFRSEGVPLDVLVTDTDYKSPNTWDGWEIDPTKFPDPTAFFAWAKSEGLHNTLNIHPGIDGNDPQYAQAQATAQGKLIPSTSCHGASTCYTFDWSDPNQLKAYLALHQTMEQQGVDFWWLDYCCDNSEASMPGVTTDAWINQQYATDTAKNIGRGFAFSRAYGSLQAGGYSGPTGVPTGPWADKRTTVHFTGDTTSDWQTLKFEVGYTPGESAATGLSAVSDDIGGFNDDGTQAPGADPGSTKLSDDLYVRWVQFGAFQPIFRLHGNHSDRLPWQYGAAAKTAAEQFMNLRENLVPYTYTIAKQANATGVPVVRPTYLEYPDQQGAYDSADSEYLYGPNVLVAPATSGGATATTSVWFPPGSWTDYFTGATYTGPSTQDITTDWNAMPVFVKAGGIVSTRTDNVTNDDQSPLTRVTLDVATGASGSYSLYEDNGSSTDPGQSATTAITYTENAATGNTLHIAPIVGRYPGEITSRTWTVKFSALDQPSTITINGIPAEDTSYDAATRTETVTIPATSTATPITLAYR
ncbi:MAG TPA: TIM-barrel domain-containing protein [Pseudonocardiaceae bacterium]|jgi:hypothetical protein|nr:TIM-barrel domain-containing protein [Pseudonocardiaceae bacterium]